MVVIGRGEGEVLHCNNEQQRSESRTQYADQETVMMIAHQIANQNAELMRRLA